MKKILLLFLLVSSFTAIAQIKVGGWNANVHLPAGYNLAQKYPTFVFMPGLGEIGNDTNKLVLYGPHALLHMGINPLPGWIIISLQPPAAYPNELAIQLRLRELATLYSIDTNRVNLTGLSHGGWCSSTYVSGILNYINTVITVQGVIPDDNSPYPYGFSNFRGTGYLCFEQRLDGRGGQTVVNYINSLRPGIATFIETNFGGGGHCCWNEFYGGGGTMPARFAALNNQSLYEWLIGKNAFNVVALPPVVQQPATPSQTFYFDNYNLFYKTTRLTGYSIYNVVGQQVASGNATLGLNKISISQLPKGFYFFKTKLYNNYKFYKY